MVSFLGTGAFRDFKLWVFAGMVYISSSEGIDCLLSKARKEPGEEPGFLCPKLS